MTDMSCQLDYQATAMGESYFSIVRNEVRQRMQIHDTSEIIHFNASGYGDLNVIGLTACK
jgi:hypothetical protein